ncbi:MAG: hypothetical protein IT289_08920 [Oligoflexia bacterium]|nr:hypothetical protein [Oligoflexia bacterium]
MKLITIIAVGFLSAHAWAGVGAEIDCQFDRSVNERGVTVTTRSTNILSMHTHFRGEGASFVLMGTDDDVVSHAVYSPNVDAEVVEFLTFVPVDDESVLSRFVELPQGKIARYRVERSLRTGQERTGEVYVEVTSGQKTISDVFSCYVE